MASSKLLCAVVWGATLWCCVVVPFASLRLNFDIQFTKDLDTDSIAVSDAQAVDTRLGTRELLGRLSDPVRKYARLIFDQPAAKSSRSMESMCTMVMLTYKREKLLSFLLNHYCKVRTLHRIIVVWNDVNTSIPEDIVNIRNECTTDLVFIREKVNKLTNRFKPRPEIETDCVCIIDDDRFIVDLRDLEFAFDMWREFRYQIVGFEHRTHSDSGNGSFWYDLRNFRIPRTNYSMMLTATAVLHKAYLEMFFDRSVLPKGMIDYIDERRNCEDIGINIMVAQFLQDLGYRQAACLAVKPKREIKNLESANEGEYKGLSSLSDHFSERSRCLNDFKVMYGGALPLVHSTFIVEDMRSIRRTLRIHSNMSRYHNHTHRFRSGSYPLNGTVNSTVYNQWLMEQRKRSGVYYGTRKVNATGAALNSTRSVSTGQFQRSSRTHFLRSGKNITTHHGLNNHHPVNKTSPRRVALSGGETRMKRENVDQNYRHLL